jgi:hypothetical protein
MSVHFFNLTPAFPECRSRRKQELQSRLERVFDKLYAEAERILQEHRPCKVKMNQHGASCLDCRVQRRETKVNELCCGGCKWHKADRGCTANKPLTCKTWLCFTAQHGDPEAQRRLQRVAERVRRLGFYVGRGDREDSIQNAMAYFGFGERKYFPTLAEG